MTWNIVNADARDTGLPDRHFHTIATSPPYFGLREYGDDDREIGDEATPEEYIAEMVKVGREARRVLRDDGTWWLNLGDSYSSPGGSDNRLTSSLNGTLDHQKNTSHQSPRRSTIGSPKNLLMIPQRVALALQADGWIVRAQIPWVKASCMPESVRDRPTTAHEYVFLLAKSQRYFWDADAVRVPHAETTDMIRQRESNFKKNNTIGASHVRSMQGNPEIVLSQEGRNIRTSDFFNAGLDAYQRHMAHIREQGGLLLSPDGDPLAFLVNPIGNKLAHFAMWPPRLVAPMIKASTSEKGCCAQCGAPWLRVVERGESSWGRRKADGAPMRYGSDGSGQHQKRGPSSHAIDRASGGLGLPARRNHKGFAPSCECNAGDPIPCRVLDPFAGSGTTLQVCEALGRDSTGVELMAKNLPIVHERMATRLHPDDLSELPKADPRQRTLFG
jgi:DNA modification methylase